MTTTNGPDEGQEPTGKKQSVAGSGGFQWNAVRQSAAVMVAEDKLSDDDIAEKSGISRVTLWRWKVTPEFQVRVGELREAIRKAVRARGIAIVENRVAALQDRWERMQRVIEERGNSDQMKNVPGGSTGLLVHNVKSIGSGEFAERVDLYEVDTGLLAELRQHEMQAAKELGQWTEKKVLGGDEERPVLVKVLKGVSSDEL